MKRRLGRFLVKHRTHISVITVIVYLAVIAPVTIILFPDSTLWLGLLIVLVSFLDELKDLIDQLVDDEEDQQELEGQI